MSHALEHDHRFAISFFIPEEITDKTPVPDFHVEVSRDMMNTKMQYYCCAIPRDHAKTTLAKITCVKHWLFTDTRFIVYLSNTSEVASAAVNDIVGYLESDNFTAYHRGVCGSDIRWITRQTHHGFYMFDLWPGTVREKRCIIKALGAGKQVRGINVDNQRPDLAVVDDLETTEILDTEIGYKKLKKWFYGTFLKAMDKFWHKVIQLGNMTAYKCLIRDHTESKFWSSVRYGCLLANGLPLWPEAWPLEKLRLDWERYREQGMLSIWYAEMMNIPLAEGAGLIASDEIRYRGPVLPEECEWAFLTVDPAISAKASGHKCALAVHAFVDEQWQLVESYGAVGMDPMKLFDKIIELCYRWKINVVGIEAVAYQAALKYVFQHFCLEKHIEGIQFVDLMANARKAERFAVYCAGVKSGLYVLTDNDIFVTQQMLMFDPKRKDNDCDDLDAAAYAPQMIAKYLGLIMNTFKGGKPMEDGYAGITDIAEF